MLVKGASRAAPSRGRCPNPTLRSYLHLSIALSPFMDNVTVVAHGRCSVTVGLYHEQRSETKESNNRSWPAASAVACMSNAPLGTFRWPLQPSSQPVSQQWGAADCAQPGKLWPLQAGCPTASSTEAHGIYLPGKPQLLEPGAGTAQHTDLSKYIVLTHPVKPLGQVLICPTSREDEQNSDTPASRVALRAFSPFHF